jgi:ADP-ribose pyrophosphatase
MDMEKNYMFDKEKDIEISSIDTVYRGFWNIKRYYLRHRLFDGGWSNIFKRELLERRAVAACLPYDPINDNVVLIEQFRIGALMHYPWLLEIVAGIADGENERPEQIVHREMKEESGLIALELEKIYEYWVSPGGTNEYLTLYCAKVDTSEAGGIYGLKEENEDIFVHVLKTKDAFRLLTTGKIKNAITIIGLQWLQLNKNQIDRRWIG